MTVVVIVAVVAAVVLYEADLYQKNKRFKAMAVQIVTPPGKRWWQKLLDTLFNALIVILLIVAVLRFLPRGGSAPGPADDWPMPSTTPTDGTATTPSPVGTEHSTTPTPTKERTP